MTQDRDRQDDEDGLANDSLASSRRPAGRAPDGPAPPAHPAGTPQGERIADEQIPKE
ncbi:hypothetical protein [Methylobacterium sp. JK268]